MRQARTSTKAKPVAQQANLWLRSRRFTVIILAVLAVIGVSLVKELIRKVEIQRQITSLQQDIDQLDQHNQALNDMMAYFNSSSFQDKQARQKLNLKLPGETVVMMTDPTTGEVNSTSVGDLTTTAAAPKEPNYRKWQNYFFN